MKRELKLSRRLSPLSAAVVAGLCAAPVSASSLLSDRGLDACTTINCGAIVVDGWLMKDNLGDAIPFTAQVYAGVGECVRLDVTTQSSDLELVLISPSGAIWRNDDRNGAADRRPLLRARADVKGFYTVQISTYNGNPAVNSVQAFTLAYGRYFNPTANNCPNVSTPFAAQYEPEKQ